MCGCVCVSAAAAGRPSPGRLTYPSGPLPSFLPPSQAGGDQETTGERLIVLHPTV